MQAVLVTALTCLLANTLAKPVDPPVISGPANWPSSPSKLGSHFGGMRPAARIAEGSSHLLERIIDAQTLLYAMLIVAVEPKPDYVPIGHNDFFPEVPSNSNEVNDLDNHHYTFGIPAESILAGNKVDDSDAALVSVTQDLEAVPYDLFLPKMVV